jgi:hypothetical protein
MCHVKHDVVCSSMLNERLQLIFQIWWLLSGKARYRVKTAETLRRNAMANFAILQLRLDVSVDTLTPLRPARGCKRKGGQCRGPSQGETDERTKASHRRYKRSSAVHG